ncbi:MAG: 4Fe-4S dicluster domain-containing protein [bacterium]
MVKRGQTNQRCAVLKRIEFQQFLDILTARGYRILGPTMRDSAIILDEIRRVEELPIGWQDVQSAGSYRLKKQQDKALFGYVVGLQSWKRTLLPPEQVLSKAEKSKSNWRISGIEPSTDQTAFLGVRPCDLQAIIALDRVFLHGDYVDTHYQARRKDALVIVVNCAVVGGNCFCTAMGTGPRAIAGFDLALTEIVDSGSGHRFFVEIGSDRGAEICREGALGDATEEDRRQAEAISSAAAARIQRIVDTTGLKEQLSANTEHPRWKEVASRCLTCGNCTMVCPTCFCSTMLDDTSLDGSQARRLRRWDSCFTMEYSYIHGGSIRYSPQARYRQWLTHKFATWVDQYGSFGCVGCGRCITWCPAGIDVTEEIRELRRSRVFEKSSQQ